MRITLINGFLGSGKTTLLKRMISYFNYQRIAVIVNEFGDTSIDTNDLSELTSSIKEINNGSIFCSCKSSHFLNALLECDKALIDHVFVETSGFSDPSSIQSILNILEKKMIQDLDEIIVLTVVNAVTIQKVINHLPLVKKQIQWADIILLNKIDIVEKPDIDSALKIICEINSIADVYKTEFSNLDLKLLDSFKGFSLTRPSSIHTKNLLFDSLSVKLDSVDITLLNQALLELNQKVYRIKGFINFTYQVNGVFQEKVSLKKVRTETNSLVFLFNKSIITRDQIEVVLQDYNIIKKGTH